MKNINFKLINKILSILFILTFSGCSVDSDQRIKLISSEKYLNEIFECNNSNVYITYDSTLVYKVDTSGLMRTNRFHALLLVQALSEVEGEKYTYFNKIKVLKNDSTYKMNASETAMLKWSFLTLKRVIQYHTENDYTHLFSLIDTTAINTSEQQELLTHCTSVFEKFGAIDGTIFFDFVIDSNQTILYKGAISRKGRNSQYEIKFNQFSKIVGGTF